MVRKTLNLNQDLNILIHFQLSETALLHFPLSLHSATCSLSLTFELSICFCVAGDNQTKLRTGYAASILLFAQTPWSIYHNNEPSNCYFVKGT